MPHATHPLGHLLPGCYACVMGRCSLVLAWFYAASLKHEAATVLFAAIAVLATAVFAVLPEATLLRARRHPESGAGDRRHPVCRTQVATLPILLILLEAAEVALLGTPGGSCWPRSVTTQPQGGEACTHRPARRGGLAQPTPPNRSLLPPCGQWGSGLTCLQGHRMLSFKPTCAAPVPSASGVA